MVENTPRRRRDGRQAAELRAVTITPGYQTQALGSSLISMGGTRVLCAATVTQGTPDWLKARAQGWVTAEYAMLPASSPQRVSRRPSGRATEIQRLVGRSLRSVVKLDEIQGMTITIDCDVIDADGGTRTAAITGSWVALHLAFQRLVKDGALPSIPLSGQVAAVSVGLVDGRGLLDLDFGEDQEASVDLNVVGTDSSTLVEVQGTAEGHPFERAQLDDMLDLAQLGIARLVEAQRRALGLG